MVSIAGCSDDAGTPVEPDAAPPTGPDAGAPDAAGPPVNALPGFVVESSLVATYYDGVSDDLLTAGLGLTGLQGGVPTFADPAAPTVAELRRNAIYSNYRALHDTSSAGGFGRISGPNIGADGQDTGGEGLIAGWEYLAYGDDGSGADMVTMMVQVPDSFDSAAPCIITAPSSGSRGVYGAIGTSGDWGLKRGCAVAYTDQGKGIGFHNLATGQARGMRGELVDADDPGANFSADLSDAELATLNTEAPNRFAIKHVHSKQNPEAHWGRYVLESIEFAFYVVNERVHGDADPATDTPYLITPETTLVIAAGVSNGGSAALHATEEDRQGLIDVVVASEPNAQPPVQGELRISADGRTLEPGQHSRLFLDHYSLLALYQPCAALTVANQEAPLLAPLDSAANEARCASLREADLLTADDLAGQADEAQQIIDVYGMAPDANILLPAHQGIQFPASVTVGYANAYGRYGVEDRLCGFSYAAVAAGQPVAISAEADAALFATANGLPPTGGLGLIYDDSRDGAVEHRQSISPSTDRADIAFDGFQCLRDSWLATDSQVAAGNEAVRHSGDLGGRPGIVLVGRSDAVLPINHTVRPYYGKNQLIEGDASRLHYYEIVNAHHLDVLNAFPGFDERYVPIQYYFEQALELMWRHLRDGDPLPPSQVVRTVPRGKQADAVPALDLATHLTPVAASPDTGDLITLDSGTLTIPE